MTDLATALALVLVIEGALYALFPAGMKRMVVEVVQLPVPTLRTAGAVAAALGLAALWALRG